MKTEEFSFKDYENVKIHYYKWSRDNIYKAWGIVKISHGMQKKPKDIVYLEDENGRKAKIETLNKMSFGSYNKAFKPARTRFDWLSRDASEVDKYIDNEFCCVSLPPDFSVISSLASRK